jgi:UDP-N-acetylglucosamine 2-epimerase (non-hydrolysing)
MESRPERRVSVLLGTRPEAIKLAPVVRALRTSGAAVHLIITGQHRELASDVLRVFRIVPDGDLALMRPGQTLDYLVSAVVEGVGAYIEETHPAAIVVQGDTTSAFASALAGFHHGVPVAHVEAGLRSHNLAFPFPEEWNRRAIGILARWHFAPTDAARSNLEAEGVTSGVHVTGNTIVDSLQTIIAAGRDLPAALTRFVRDADFVVATAHRRESWGEPIRNVARAVAKLLEEKPELRVVFVTHPNPLAALPVREVLGSHPRALVVDAVQYPSFIRLLARARFAVSDSGGVQEEGATLGVPVLVTRSVTERLEGIEAGAAELVGTDPLKILDAAHRLLNDPALRETMASAGRTIYGDGRAAERIANVLKRDVGW